MLDFLQTTTPAAFDRSHLRDRLHGREETGRGRTG
jgi:hypothetical protein